MSTIDSTLLKHLRVDIDKALEDVAKKHGVTFSLGRISFNATTASAKLEVAALTEGGTPRDIPAELFLQYADIIGLKKENLHQEITIQGEKFQVAGYKPKARKNNIIIKSKQGKTYVTSLETVKRQLSK